MEKMIVDKKRFVPKLRFKGFEDNWKTGSLKKIAVVNPKTRNLPKVFVYIDLESVTDGRLVKEESISINEAPSRAQRVLDKDDILYQTVRPYQKNNLYFNRTGDYVASTGYAQIKSKGDSKYLFQFLHTTSFVNIVNRWSTGTSYPAISPSELAKIEVAYPSLKEQQKIASFLTATDRKLQQLNTKKTLLEQYKRGVMQQLFSQKLRFKDDDERDHADWEEKKLSDVATIITGSTPPTNNLDFYNGDRLFVSPSDIDNSRFIKTTKTRITDLGFCVGRMVKKGSVVFVCIGSTIGKVAQLTEDSITNQQINSLVCKQGNSNDFLYSLLEHNGVRIKLLAGVQAVPQINKTDFSTIKFDFPKLKEQQKIANYLSAIDGKIERVSQQIDKTQQFKKGLLQQMFV